MGITLRPLEDSATKFAARAAVALPDYTKGIANPRRDQAAQAAAAEPAYEAGVMDAIGRKSFGKGVRKAGTAKWQARAGTLGVQRFASGVLAAKADWQAGFAPYAQVLTSLPTTQRGPRGSAANFEISRAVGQALADKRRSGAQ